MSQFFRPKRMMVGRPLDSARLGETLLPKRLALPIFCSDPLSSVAYATEEILLVVGLGGIALLHLTWYAAAAIVLVLVTVVASYRQTCYAYPSGGGAYRVSAQNLGRNAALTAASALLVDYVLTVAVSVVSGVAAITSAIPSLGGHDVALSVGFVALLVLMNLRGVRESGRVFAVPTYGFVFFIYLMFVFAAVRMATGAQIRAESADLPLHPVSPYTGLALVLLAMRAFASGCTALTGVEAISNGVPAFRRPKSRNAANTLLVMGFFSVTMFGGITILAMLYDVHVAVQPTELGLPPDTPTSTALAQIARATFGDLDTLFYLLQAFTAGVLILAANTAFNGFPMLASILAEDGFVPRQLHNRGDRLVFSNGIVLLALAAIGLIILFDAELTRLIQLYIIGVFVSFTLSQTGMVRHWRTVLAAPGLPSRERARHRRSQAINAVGAVLTGVVLVIVLITKFLHGAWIVVIAMPLLFLGMRGIHQHYGRLGRELAVAPDARPWEPAGNHVRVLVNSLHAPTLKALGYARAMRPTSLEALTVAVEPGDVRELRAQWDAHDIDVPLQVLSSPYRDFTRPVIDYLLDVCARYPGGAVTVVIPEYVVGRWWEQPLHNQSALRLKARLLFTPGVTVVNVPYRLPYGKEQGET
ncbi:APC family permease [Streptomyces sp. Je 1-4]|uniref:APC family permease n=1 Tax=Streptomyces TaxID=1883 RepID=UPI0021DA060A|nr:MULTISPECIES: APC family permease [unclassified Streptomyces]UYB39022.1 APC family permease [Streptomyces sp. Je 1-4]UZQ35022.1 APC family permease [Streptomyces sp. Je 1-4] [Streptomyces sp. Je 1-4 4N24]UZQ42440.1 APC family permease [Streptomyces sp. Je 1-4] [Streptomyces sp. Je 1-4 4N24_ara]